MPSQAGAWEGEVLKYHYVTDIQQLRCWKNDYAIPNCFSNYQTVQNTFIHPMTPSHRMNKIYQLQFQPPSQAPAWDGYICQSSCFD